MLSFDQTAYGPVFGRVVAGDRLCPLGPGEGDEASRDLLNKVTAETAFEHAGGYRDEDLARACVAGCWLLHNFLDESHVISQSIDTPEGSFWHGIMHRREPDASNAKHWFRKVGTHPVFDPLELVWSRRYDASLELPEEPWDPAAFVDLCERVRDTGSDAEQTAIELQRAEWELLFDFCYREAVGA